MATSPVFASAVYSKSGPVLEGGSWTVEDGTPVTIAFTPGSSGVDNSPYVRHRISWGDGRQESFGEFLPVGREYTYSHYFSTPGTYVIRVELQNRSNLSSDPTGGINPSSLIVVRQKPVPPRKVIPAKYSGPALPVNTVAGSISLVESVYPEATTTLAVRVLRDSNRLPVIAVPQPAEGASIVLTQDGKLISSGRVLSVEGNILILDSAVVDTYDAGALVTVSRQAIPGATRDLVTQPIRQPDWGFPAVKDAELVRASLALLFGTRPFERVMRPQSGCRIHEQIFEPADFLGAQITRRYVLDAALAEPRVSVEAVTATVEDHTIQINAAVRFRSYRDEVFDVTVPVMTSGARE